MGLLDAGSLASMVQRKSEEAGRASWRRVQPIQATYKWVNFRAGKKGACRAIRLTGPVWEMWLGDALEERNDLHVPCAGKHAT